MRTDCSMRALGEQLLIIGIGAASGYAVTYAVKHFVPQLFFLWLFAGAGLAFVLACWKPRWWILAATSVVSLVIPELLLSLDKAGPTAAALAIGFGIIWVALALGGAWLGRQLASGKLDRASGKYS